MNLNLLPWRQEKYHHTLKRVIWGCLGAIILVVGIAGMLWHQTQRRLEEQNRRTQQLQLALRASRNLPQQQHQETVHVIQASKVVVRPPLKIQVVTIHYASAVALVGMIKDRSAALLSHRGKVTVDPRTNVIWLEDTPKHLQKLLTFIKLFDLPAQQIVIEARLVNMNQEAAQDLGVRLGFIMSPHQGVEGNTPPVSGQHLGMELAAKPLEATAAALGLTQALLASQRLLDVELSALESQGRAKVIASPRLVTSNQMAAVIESGEDIPYQEFSAHGTTSIAFKKAVLRLKVVPQITGQKELTMALVINQDADSGKRVQGVPIISTKSIETRILVHDGQTIVLGGIYQQDHNRQIDQVPFLGDLPLIGDMFRRKHWHTRHEALLIFITPRIIVQRPHSR